MKEELLKEILIQDDKRAELGPILKTAYSIEPKTEEELIKLAKEINEKLECELFENMNKEELIADFSMVARRVTRYVFEKGEFRNERLEKALKENIEVLEEVVEANNKFDSLSGFEIFMIAMETNKKLGYDLFPDPHYPVLKGLFPKVAEAVELYKKEGKIIKYIK